MVSATSTEEAFEKAAAEAVTKENDPQGRLLNQDVPWSLVHPDAFYFVKEVPFNQTVISISSFLEHESKKCIKFNKGRLNPVIKRLVARTR